MKAEYVAESRTTSRIAPYVSAVGVIGVCLSFFWVTPLLWCLALGSACGGLLLFLHVKKWRTGREEFQFAAMAAGMLPVFIMIYFKPGFPQAFQCIGVFMVAYYGATVALRRKILTWIQP
jgi:energy-coupling factor transporter transmembrane protein EcfT